MQKTKTLSHKGRGLIFHSVLLTQELSHLASSATDAKPFPIRLY